MGKNIINREKVYFWPDGGWTHEDDIEPGYLEEHDDFGVLYIDEDISAGDIDLLVRQSLTFINKEGNFTTFSGEDIGHQVPKDEIPDAAYEPDPESTTCWDCKDKDTCPYAFDAYNTDGDCIADK